MAGVANSVHAVPNLAQQIGRLWVVGRSSRYVPTWLGFDVEVFRGGTAINVAIQSSVMCPPLSDPVRKNKQRRRLHAAAASAETCLDAACPPGLFDIGSEQDRVPPTAPTHQVPGMYTPGLS